MKPFTVKLILCEERRNVLNKNALRRRNHFNITLTMAGIQGNTVGRYSIY